LFIPLNISPIIETKNAINVNRNIGIKKLYLRMYFVIVEH
jgi:hypothetical protein